MRHPVQRCRTKSSEYFARISYICSYPTLSPKFIILGSQKNIVMYSEDYNISTTDSLLFVVTLADKHRFNTESIAWSTKYSFFLKIVFARVKYIIRISKSIRMVTSSKKKYFFWKCYWNHEDFKIGWYHPPKKKNVSICMSKGTPIVRIKCL